MKFLRNYRHIICITVTAVFILFGVFVFNGSAWRFVESGKTLVNSIAYAVLDLFDLSYIIEPMWTSLPQTPPWAGVLPARVPKIFLPETWAEFGTILSRYGELLIDWRMLLQYLLFLLKTFLNIITIFYYMFLLTLLVKALWKRYLTKHSNDDDKESKSLKYYKRAVDVTIRPIRRFFVDLYVFIKNSYYWHVWALLLCLYGGVFSIAMETFAFLFYFTTTFDFTSIYYWVYKVVYDIAGFFEMIPALFTIIFAISVYEMFCRKLG